MISISSGEVHEMIDRLDEVARLISDREGDGDVNLGEALDNIFELKAILQTNLESFEGMLDAMSYEYD